ncbi:hypothetical protein WKK05_33215 [Nostoc sp. UHCC 0302]
MLEAKKGYYTCISATTFLFFCDRTQHLYRHWCVGVARRRHRWTN